VIRQVAEAVADIEEAGRADGSLPAAPPAAPAPEAVDEDSFPDPVIPIEMLKEALADNRLVCHIEPVVALPQRRPYGYDLVPRLALEDGELADPPDFLPRRGHAEVMRRLEALMLEEAIVIARRSRTNGMPIRLFVPLTRASVGDPEAVAPVLATLEANRAVADALIFVVAFADWRAMTPPEKAALAGIGHLGAAFSLAGAATLRLDFGELEGIGFTSVRFDATRFLRDPNEFTDFHTADIAAYGRRFHLDLIVTGVIDEQQLLSFLEDGIVLVSGPHVGSAGPVRPDLMVERTTITPSPRRAEAR